MNPSRDLARLELRLAEVQALLSAPDERLYLRVEAVSAWSTAQHLDHILKSLELMLGRVDALLAGADPEIRRRGSPAGVARVVMLTGWIPRGRGEAPESVLPDPRPVRFRLDEGTTRMARRVAALQSRANEVLEAVGRLPHPMLGAFRAAHWVRFADIHTKHHLAIVAELDRHRAVGERAPETAGREELDGLEVGAEPS